MVNGILFGSLLTYSLLFVGGHGSNSCDPLPTQKNTSAILSNLRAAMTKENINVYVIFADDEHGSEYTQPYDKRRDWLSGFKGSAGTAVVSLDSAALWTDSRYFTQAEEQLDCRNWLLMRSDTPGVPSLIDWLVSETNKSLLSPGTPAQFASSSWWSSASAALTSVGKHLVDTEDLVSLIWSNNERDPPLQRPIVSHDERYAGETIVQKLDRVTKELKTARASATVLSSLDEIAWLFNLRGADIPYNPFFKSYAIVYADYQTHQPELFLNQSQISTNHRPVGVLVDDYSRFWTRLPIAMSQSFVERVWVSPRASQAILNKIPEQKLQTPLSNSPVQRVKARKNKIERMGMRQCQVRDAIARMKHLGWLEDQLNLGRSINETQSSEQLLVYQKQQELFQFPSFNTISASGDRAAVVHYSAQPSSARLITKNQVYLLDAGGQYLDCTTDITRTHHFGMPSDLEKRAYTRVLQGVLDVAAAVFPKGTMGRSIDYLGRMASYKDGLTFGHTVGHGIGHYLGVHEGPQRIGPSYSQYEEALSDGVFLSDEPGYYKPGDFGIRIENDIEVVVAQNGSDDQGEFLRFETITLLPYERSLIDVKLLSRSQIDTINEYHRRVLEVLEPKLVGDEAALMALKIRTANLSPFVTESTTTTTSSKTFTLAPKFTLIWILVLTVIAIGPATQF